MRVEQKHRQTVTVGIISNRSKFTVDHTQLQVLPMLVADRWAAYVKQNGYHSLTVAQRRQARKSEKRAIRRVAGQVA